MLEKSKLEDEQEARRAAKKLGKEVAQDIVENDENDGDKSNTIQQAVREFEEAAYGVSKPKVIQMEGDIIDDKYNVQTEVDKNKLFAEDDSEKSKREDFLKIFKENEKKQKNAEPESNLDSNIRFRQEEDEDQDFKLNTSAQPGKKPLITEIGTGPAIAEAPKTIQTVEVPFSWTDAQRVELKPQFIAQADFVFLNINLKGYNPDEDVKYALSSDELLIEIRDRSAPKGVSRVRRLC